MHCPPGHAKKGWCTPGGPAAPAPRCDHIEVDRGVFLIIEAIREVLEAISAVDRVLR